jgi:hypothetical protein
VGKQRSNPKYFKTKKLQSKIFNQLNIKKKKKRGMHCGLSTMLLGVGEQ